jgi:hypothetical protein
MLEIKFLEITPTRIKRILTMFLVLLLAFITTFAGVVTPMMREEAEATKKEFEKFEKVPDELMFQLIFGNNFYICFLMFIPFLGPILGFYAFYNTGRVIGAVAIAEGADPATIFMAIFILPFAWLEYIAYSIAISQSFWLTLRIFRRKAKMELIKTCMFIVLCAIILIIAAVIETMLILSIPKT